MWVPDCYTAQLTVRFLITTPEWSVLHTGDVRADESFMRNLQRTPVLQAYIPPAADLGTTTNTLRRRLDRIYIDTSALWVAIVADKSSSLTRIRMSFSDMGTKVMIPAVIYH